MTSPLHLLTSIASAADGAQPPFSTGFIPAAIVRVLQLDDPSCRAVYGVTIEWFGKRPSATWATEAGRRQAQQDALHFVADGDSKADKAIATRWARS